MAITDLIIAACCLFLIWRGASRGFLRSLVGPVCLIIFSLIATLIIQWKKDIPLALCVGIFGPFIAQWLILGSLSWWHNSMSSDWKPALLSQVSGALLTLIWGLTFIGLLVVFLAIAPTANPKIKSIQADINRSYSYKIMEPINSYFMQGIFPKGTKTKMNGPDSQQSILDDARFQKVLQDPEIQKEIKANDIGKLLSNPKMMELTQEMMQDPQIMQRLMAAYKQKQIEEQTQSSIK